MPELEEFDLRYYEYRKYILEKSYCYQIGEYKIIIPKGFVTDLASIPKIFWNIFEPDGKGYTKAAVVHDYLYSKECVYNLKRKEADKIFLAIMKERGVSFFKRTLMYNAVRMFGANHFRKE